MSWISVHLKEGTNGLPLHWPDPSDADFNRGPRYHVLNMGLSNIGSAVLLPPKDHAEQHQED